MSRTWSYKGQMLSRNMFAAKLETNIVTVQAWRDKGYPDEYIVVYQEARVTAMKTGLSQTECRGIAKIVADEYARALHLKLPPPRFREEGRHLPTYNSYRAMLQRCYNPNHMGYPYYGKRGIRVCNRWLVDIQLSEKSGYKLFVADMGLRPEGKSLERMDVNGNYEPSNCRWATLEEQRANRRNSTK